MDFTTAIFDLDGTLIDSIHVWEKVDIKWLSMHNIKPERHLLNRFKVMNFDEAVSFVQEELGVKETAEYIIDTWSSMVKNEYAHNIPLKKGARELLTKYKNEGKRIALATSCVRECCESVLANNKIRDYFEEIVYTTDIGRSKSYPDVYLKCAHLLGSDPSDCVAFEDIYLAIAGVRAAGMRFVGVYDPMSSIGWDDMIKEADLCVKSLEELL
ncbi:MAG: HAD family phosphatase [Bacillota bacterium]|nr:HAD family phosphatase [Bacillota bacterium]